MVVVALLLGSAVWRRCYGVESSVCSTSKAVDAAAATRVVLQSVRSCYGFCADAADVLAYFVEIESRLATLSILPGYAKRKKPATEASGPRTLASCETLACRRGPSRDALPPLLLCVPRIIAAPS